MANEIKYVSLSNLDYYDGKIKEHIADADAALKENLEGQVTVVANALDGEITRAKAAEATNAAAAQAAHEAADKAQSEVDSLETLVGTLPTGTDATSVVDYVNKKTAGIATDAALGELQGQLNGVQGDVATIKGDYLKAADKTELSNAIADEKERAEGVEGGLRTDVDAIKADYLKGADKTALQGAIDGVAEDVADIVADYLKAADKTELEGKINAKVAQVDYDAKMEEIGGDIDGLQTQINTIMNNPDAEGAINSINEFTQYVADHGTIADGFRVDIDKNKDDIAAMDTAYKAADTAIKGRLDVLEAIDYDAYVDSDSALKSELEGKINLKADTTALEEAVEALEAVDTGLGNRITALETAVGDGGSVAQDIESAKDEAVSTAAADAKTKADNALASAKTYTDTEVGKDRTRLDALEAASATHALASDLTTLAGRVTVNESAISGHTTRLDAVEAKASSNETAIGTLNTTVATKAAASDLETVSGRVDVLEAWHENFVECDETDINNLFA